MAKDYFDTFDNYLIASLDSLNIKYDGGIHFDQKTLDKLELLSIQMFTRNTSGGK